MWVSPDSREYFGIQLSSSLIVGQHYFVSLKVGLAEFANCATNNLGVLFSTISHVNSPFINPVNSAMVNSSSIISDTVNWTSVSGSFIADSVYEYIFVGNFFDGANTDTLILSGNVCQSYYYIDDICVSLDSSTCQSSSQDCDTVGISAKKLIDKISIYPNPYINTFTVKNLGYPIGVDGTVLSISNILGAGVYMTNIVSDSETVINGSQWPAGIYFITLQSGSQIFTQKLIHHSN